MRVWLVAFVLLFATIELFEWLVQLGSWQPTGMWLVLGGMGLAALSNASHIPKNVAKESKTSSQLATEQIDSQSSDTQQKAASPPISSQRAAQRAAQLPETKSQKVATSLSDESDKDSISFKVRPLKR